MADMRYRRLGNSGLAVSVVGIGCNNFGAKLDAAQTQTVVDTAIDEGITLFDTADTYGNPQGSSEEFLGAALKANGRRDDVVRDRRDGGAEKRAETARPERNTEHVVPALENLDLIAAAHAVDIRAAIAERQVHVRVRHDLLPIRFGVVPPSLPVVLHPWRECR